MHENLHLNEFKFPNKEEWAKKIIKELQLNSFNDVKWTPFHTFEIDPFYTKKDIPENSDFLRSKLRFDRSNKVISTAKISASNLSTINSLINTYSLEGTYAFEFDINTLQHILKDFNKNIKYAVLRGISPIKDYEALYNAIPQQLEGFLEYQLNSNLAEIPTNIKSLLEKESKLKAFGVNYPQMIKQADKQIAYLLSSAVDIVNQLTDAKVKPAIAFNNIQFSITLSNSFFIEIAKIRALKILWNLITTQFDPSAKNSNSIDIYASTTPLYNEDDLNIISNTGQALAAVIGGARIISYNSHNQQDNSFYNRINRNISLLINEEADILSNIDAAGGSYYIEILTQELLKSSYQMFQAIERKGGLKKALESNNLDELFL